MSKASDLDVMPKVALREIADWLDLQGRVAEELRGAVKDDLLEILSRKLDRDQVAALVGVLGDKSPYFSDNELAAILGLPQKEAVLQNASKAELVAVMEELEREGRCEISWRRSSADELRDYIRRKLDKTETAKRFWDIETDEPGSELVDDDERDGDDLEESASQSGAVHYDVALSFAGEDRGHAEALAVELRRSGVRVFYDAYEKGRLWGRDLYVHLHDVYCNKARYCVIFVSAYYAQKVWTTHEHASAQERALRERGAEYILPIRIDATALPGLRETIGYVDISDGPSEIASMLLGKLSEPLRA